MIILYKVKKERECHAELDSASNKIKYLRDPEIPPTAGFRVTDWDFLRLHQIWFPMENSVSGAADWGLGNKESVNSDLIENICLMKAIFTINFKTI